MLIFMFLVFHMTFFLESHWFVLKETQIIAFFILFLLFEDFLWFVFNPYFGLKNFKKEKVWWHSKSKWTFGLFPIDYILGLAVSIILLYFSSLIGTNKIIFYEGLITIGFMFFLTFLSILFVKSYRRWYKDIRKKDEKHKFDMG